MAEPPPGTGPDQRSPSRNRIPVASRWRHDSLPACGQQFTPAGRQRWCPERCRAAGCRRRKQAASPDIVLPEPRPRRPRTVYACDACGNRSLGVQYCQDCQTFMRRVGLGAPCPCCLLTELLDVSAAQAA